MTVAYLNWGYRLVEIQYHDTMDISPICGRLLLIMTVILLGILQEVLTGNVCPPDVVTAVFTCLAPLRGQDANQLVTAGDDLDAIKERCRDGSFPSAVRCVQVLLWLCRHSRQLSLLQDLTDVARMEQSFDVICDNVNLYATHRQCLVREDTTIQNCILLQTSNFYHQPKAPYDRSQEVARICSFLTKMTRCIEEPVRHFCDSGLADVLVKFMSGITPPSCKPYPSGQATTDYSNTFLLILLTTTVMCLHRMVH